MKEDILEQIASDYLNLCGYLTVTNVKYRPKRTDRDWISKEDSVHSDIDVIGFNPNLDPPSKVVAVSCKSWQGGFRPRQELDAIKNGKIAAGRERWKAYRELASPKWSRAFRQKIKELTGESAFEYWIVCTKVDDPNGTKAWTDYDQFRKNLTPYLKIVSLETIFRQTISETRTNRQIASWGDSSNY